MHFGVALPNYGADASVAGMRRIAETAEELGFHSIWTTEHFVVGPEAVDLYGRIYDPLTTLGWLAAATERIGLGTSVTLVPLHNPFQLAKQVATLQDLSGGRFTLGVGMGWHRDEFDFMGVEFSGRGARADEALRVMRALWSGESAFNGQHWSFSEATFGPLPDPRPEIWVGGPSARAIRRARELGDAWHPTRTTSPEDVARVREQYPDLRIFPRNQPELVEPMLDAGANGVIVNLQDEKAMRAFARAFL